MICLRLAALAHRSSQQAPIVVLQGGERLMQFFANAGIPFVERELESRGAGEAAVVLAEQASEDPTRFFLPGANEVWIVFSKKAAPMMVVSESAGAGWRLVTDIALLESLADDPAAQETFARLVQFADAKLHPSDSDPHP